MYHMVFKSGVQRLQRLALFVVMTIGVAGFLAAISPTQTASAATVIQNLATSSSSTLQTRWYSLRGYGSIRNEVYWPQRSDNCGGGGDKISPWQPSIVGLLVATYLTRAQIVLTAIVMRVRLRMAGRGFNHLHKVAGR